MKFPVRILISCYTKPHTEAENFSAKRRKLLFLLFEIICLTKFRQNFTLEISKRINLLWKSPFVGEPILQSSSTFENPLFILKGNKVVCGIFSGSCSKTNLPKLELFQNFASELSFSRSVPLPS